MNKDSCLNKYNRGYRNSRPKIPSVKRGMLLSQQICQDKKHMYHTSQRGTGEEIHESLGAVIPARSNSRLPFCPDAVISHQDSEPLKSH